jgi:nucleoside-triphosphatase THEP1
MTTERSLKNVLLTGPPGCGKTTVVCRLIERLGDLCRAGFYTQEIREQGQQVGFEAASLSGWHALLAHIRFRSRHRVVRYGVEQDRPEASTDGWEDSLSARSGSRTAIVRILVPGG